MSFSVRTEPHPADEIRSAIENVEPGNDISDRQTVLLRQGKQAAIALVDDGICADSPVGDLLFVVTISGHGGGDDVQAGDSVSVSVGISAP